MSTTATAPRPKTRKKALLPQDEAHVLYKDPARQAEMAGLRYATDQGPGLSRKATRAGNFAYYDAKGQKITDDKTLDRIASYVIPPAWTEVWISPSATAHLQVTGHDALGRKQYRYHPAWDDMRSLTKFSRLRTFGEKLEPLRAAAAQRPGPPGPRPRKSSGPGAHAHGPVVYSGRQQGVRQEKRQEAQLRPHHAARPARSHRGRRRQLHALWAKKACRTT